MWADEAKAVEAFRTGKGIAWGDSASTTICCAHSISVGGRLLLGAQAGEARLAEVFSRAGFTRFRRATETPFNPVLEARL